MINVSNDFKTRTKKIKQQNIKLGIIDGELTVKEVHFMPVKQFNALPVWMLRARKKVIAKELKYSFEGNLFKTIMKQIEITVKNAGELKDKNVNFQYGIYVNNNFEYIDLGDYYIKDIEDDKGKTELTVTGYDKMINFMKTFKQSELKLTYPCTMVALIQKMCEVCGVELYSTNFFNADLQVDEDYFTEQELTYRDVLEKIAESTLTTIFIKDNKLYLHKLANSPVQELDSSYLTGLTVKEKFGPVNALVLGRGDVEDNIEAKDDISISQNGRCEIRFDENEFVEYKREQVIDEMFEQIKGLEYYAFEGSDVGVMWLEPCDLIKVKDNEESTYKTIYLKANITINTGISSDIEADIPEETNTEYKVTTKEEKKTLKVERLAKKNEGQIQDLIQETTEQGQKITEVEQTVDGITQTVSSVETKVEQVENKADNAQTTADTANQNAQNAQQTANNATNQITTTNQKVSQIEQTVNNITQSVTEVEEKIETVEETANTANSTANQAKSTAETANNTANTAKNTADTVSDNLEANYFTKTETSSEIEQKANSITQEVTETVENIQIGGTNLIKDSAPYELNNEIWQKTSSKVSLNIIDETSAPSLKAFNIGATGTITDNLTGIYSIPTCNVLQKDKEYCYSMWLKASENCTITVGYPRGGRTNLNVTTNWTRHTFKFKATEPTASSHGFGIYLPQNANTSFKLYAHSIKLEEGNKITAWSPAPEDDVKGYELGTRIEQNVDAVKLAWNQISEYIQMMILNGNASLAILDSSNNVIMSLDKEGQNFYKNGQTTPFGEMGIKSIDNQNYISFSVLGEYGQTLQDGMAWGITIKDDNKFIPILYIKDFEVGPKNSETGVGKLVLSSCDIVLDAMGGGIEADGIKIHGDGLPGLWFDDVDSGKTLLCIKPDMGSISYATISILDTISFYKNQAGSNSFRIGNDNSKYCLMTDDGSFHANSIYMTGNNDGNTINLSGQVTFGNLPTYQGDKLVYGKSPHSYFMEWHDRLDFWVDTTNVGTLSDKRLKTEIKDIDEDFIKAIEEIEMKQFKVANRNGLISFGILAQDLIEIFKRYNKNPFDYEIVYETRYRTDDDTIYYAIDYTQFLILKQKAMDMKLKKLEEENKAKDKLLQELISRTEKIEGGNK